jgi:predicted small metal-binding protein
MEVFMADRTNPTPTRSGPEGVADKNTVSPGGTAGGHAGDYSFRCGDVVSGCDWQTTARTEEELRHNVEQHGRDRHGMKEIGEETWNKVKGAIRRRAA